jgi:hypothetical protein
MFEDAHLHVRCCAHILNTLVQNGMEIIHEGIKMIQELLKHIDYSPSRIRAFNQIAMMNDLPTKYGIALDMGREALKYKVVLNSYANQNAEIYPNKQEWIKAELICGFLKTFE